MIPFHTELRSARDAKENLEHSTANEASVQGTDANLGALGIHSERIHAMHNTFGKQEFETFAFRATMRGAIMRLLLSPMP
jgi:hypothetical protein